MTGIAYDALLAEAEEQFPSFPITFSDGVTVRLRPTLDLNDEEIAELSKIQEELDKLDESSNLSTMREQYLRALVLVSDNPETAEARLGGAPLKAVITLFKKYNETMSGAAKSDGSAPATS